MRDLILLAALVCVFVLTMRSSIVGLLAWIWVSFMNPQRLVYGFLSGFELNFYIAIVTILAWLVSKETKTLPKNLVVFFLIAFALWTGVTTFFALDPGFSTPLFERTAKTLILVFLTIMLANSASRIQAVLWTAAISLGYFALRGAAYILVTRGGGRVYGPANSMIEDNNSVGLAFVILLPILYYLMTSSRDKIARGGAFAALGLTAVAALGTYSRGALIALAASLLAFAVRTRAGVILLLMGGVLLASAPSLLPSSWIDRMESIRVYAQDDSFAGRVEAWVTSINIAKERPTGGGFSSVEREEVIKQFRSPGSLRQGRAAHSIYFQVLGDHGVIGLLLYLGMLAAAWINASIVIGRTRGNREWSWANQLARMLQVAIIGYAVGGAALSMAYYDFFLILIGLTASLVAVTSKKNMAQVALGGVPSWKSDAPRALLGSR